MFSSLVVEEGVRWKVEYAAEVLEDTIDIVSKSSDSDSDSFFSCSRNQKC